MPIALALDTAIAFLRRWKALLPWAIVLALLLRLYGFLWWDGVIEQRDKARAATAQCIKAGEEAKAKQIALNNQTKARYEAAAKEADNDHAKELALANDRTERWIAANRVRKTGGSRPSGAGAAAEGEAAELPQAMPADAVLVSAADVRLCTSRSQDALSAYEWGQALIKAGVAE